MGSDDGAVRCAGVVRPHSYSRVRVMHVAVVEQPYCFRLVRGGWHGMEVVAGVEKAVVVVVVRFELEVVGWGVRAFGRHRQPLRKKRNTSLKSI